MAQFRSNVAYGLTQALLAEAPVPIQARRAPTSGDMGYLPGTIWVDRVASNVYILSNIVANLATWVLLEFSGGSGSFTTLTSTGATTLATTGASVNTFGNTTGATSLSLYAGTGNMLLDGAATTAIAIGTSLTTGTISIGGSAQTGILTIGGGTAAQAINIGTAGVAAKTITIGAAASNVINIGAATLAGSTNISSGSAGTSVLSTGQVLVASSSNTADAVFLHVNNGTSETIGIVADAGTGAAAIDIQAPVGGITLRAAASKGIIISNGTQAPGIYCGTGSPNGALSAAKGSIFLNVAGSGVGDRMFVNNNGTTGWTAFTTAG